MSFPVLFADGVLPWFSLIGAVGAILLVIFIFAGIWASRYTKVGPNEVLGPKAAHDRPRRHRA